MRAKRATFTFCHFSELLKSLRSNSVARQVTFNSSKIGGKCQNFKCDILSNFQTMCAIKLEFWMENFPKNWSYISTRSTLTPHGSVASSSVCSMTWLIVSRSERISARYFVPRTLRRVVAASKCVEWLKHSNNMIYCFSNLGSSRQKGKPWKYWQSRHAIRWKSTAFFSLYT